MMLHTSLDGEAHSLSCRALSAKTTEPILPHVIVVSGERFEIEAFDEEQDFPGKPEVAPHFISLT